MPRTKAPPVVPSTALEGYTVTFASYSASCHADFTSKTLTQIKSQIASCGGSYASKIDQCTHLVASPAQYEKKLKAIKEGLQDPNLIIVDYDWLAESLKSASPVAVDDYLLDKSSAPTNGVHGSNDADEKSESESKASKADQKPNLKRKRGDSETTNTQLKNRGSKQPPPPKKKATPKVPVDDQLSTQYQYSVYVDTDGLAWDATLNQSNSNANNNKFYKIQLLVEGKDSYRCWTRWGRVGEIGQSAMLGDGSFGAAMAAFEKKFKDKNGNKWENRDGPAKSGKYVFIEINYADSDEEEEEDEEPQRKKREVAVKGEDDEEEEEEIEDIPVQSALEKPVQELMKLIFDLKLFDSTMASLNYDAKKMPLGKLSKKSLLKGYEVLKELAALIADPNTAVGTGLPYGQAVADRSNLYFSLVPHVSGRSRLPTLDNMNLIKVWSGRHSDATYNG